VSKKAKNNLLVWAGPLVIAVIGIWVYLQSGRFIETDNAYLKANKVSISSEISGKVVEVMVGDNGLVEAGQVMFRVDDQPYQIALARAQANLVKVGGDLESLKADYLNKLADISKTQNQQTFYRQEFKRLSSLLPSRAVSAAQVDQAEYQYQDAGKELEVTKQALQVVKARLIDMDLPLEQHPNYLLAMAELKKARLDLSHVQTLAPSTGIVANFNIQLGQYIIAGSPLYSLVDSSHIWVEANFKETDLTYLREGQSAEITVDSYPDLQWQGVISSIAPGTGSEFSLLPAQNSTGNWVKVVQRIMVKLDIDANTNTAPLAAGMSAEITVDIERRPNMPWSK
jgi:membrane fusion protein (multidrug efflux system)|tara:strand:+ start:477 stop:1499 length:1023 start_codon:yes stop_codon:yes gene_type:complete